jgi:hypothetical protein
VLVKMRRGTFLSNNIILRMRPKISFPIKEIHSAISNLSKTFSFRHYLSTMIFSRQIRWIQIQFHLGRQCKQLLCSWIWVLRQPLWLTKHSYWLLFSLVKSQMKTCLKFYMNLNPRHLSLIMNAFIANTHSML